MPRNPAENPAAVYRDSLSRGSYWAVHHYLETIVKLLGTSDPWTYPWHRLRYRDTARVRAHLVERYAPATVNKILSALRGVLKTCWRLGLMDAETYARAADVANVRRDRSRVPALEVGDLEVDEADPGLGIDRARRCHRLSKCGLVRPRNPTRRGPEHSPRAPYRTIPCPTTPFRTKPLTAPEASLGTGTS